MTAALEVRDLCRSFGALNVTRDVNLTLDKGARHALIGPNGAGKTTLVNLINQLVRALTVLENVALSIAERRGRGAELFRPFSRNADVVDEAMALLERLRLADDALTPVAALAYGGQRLVEIAITLGQRPTVLLLDEPAAGVPSTESHLLLDLLETLPDEIAILIIEHDMDVVFRFAERVTVLVDGAVLVEDTPANIAENADVRAVYLGERRDG